MEEKIQSVPGVSSEKDPLEKEESSSVSPNKAEKSNNKSFWIVGIISLIVILGIGVLFFSTNKSKQSIREVSREHAFTGEIVIGYNADQTTPTTGKFGVSARQGVEIAIDEINASGGILGKKLRSVILDDKADKDLSKKNTEQLIFQDEVLAIIGPANSLNALNWIDIAQENEVPVIVPIATATEITTKFEDRPRNYIFRGTSLDKDQASFTIAWLIKKTSNGKIAIIHDSTPYGLKGLKDGSEVLARWGKTPVVIKSFDPGMPIEKMVALFESTKKSGAQGIAFFNYADSQANLLKALDQIPDYNPAVIGTAANLAPEFWQLAGPLAEKLPFVAGRGLNMNERTTAFKNKVIKKFGEEPAVATSAQLGYDTIMFIKAAVEGAGSTDRVAVWDALENIDNVQGADILYKKPFSKKDHEAITVNDLFLVHWVNGKIEKYPGGTPEELEIR